MLNFVLRYLKSKDYDESISRGDTFRSSRKVLEGKARQLRQQGKGKVPNRAQSLTAEEEEVLWESNQLGNNNPRSRLQTIWWNNCLHFGMRGREEHYEPKIEDFKLEVDGSGRKYISYIEGLTKTRKGGLNFKPRLIAPKMYESENIERCPVKMFLKYKSKRPTCVSESGPLYLYNRQSLH